MPGQSAFRSLLLRTFSGCVLLAGILSLLYLLLETWLDCRIDSGMWLIWFPVFGSVIFWLFSYGTKIQTIKAKVENFLLHILGILFFALPSMAAYLVTKDLAYKVSEVSSVNDISPGKSGVIWKVNDLPNGKRYASTFESLSSGKNPRRTFETVHLTALGDSTLVSNLWLFTSDFESISNRKSFQERATVRDKNYEQTINLADKELTNTSFPVFLIPVDEGTDRENAVGILKSFHLKNADEARFFVWSKEYVPGIQSVSKWLLTGSLALCFIYFFILSLIYRKESKHNILLTELFAQIYQTPLTILIMFVLIIVFVINLLMEPNIMVTRTDSDLANLMTWKDVRGEWWRIFTAPFTDLHLVIRILSAIILYFVCSSLEKAVSKTGFILLALSGIIAGGAASMLFSKSPCYGPHVIYVCFASWYACRSMFFSGGKKLDGGVLALVAILVFLVTSLVPDTIDFPRLAGSIAAGIVLSLFVRAKPQMD